MAQFLTDNWQWLLATASVLLVGAGTLIWRVAVIHSNVKSLSELPNDVKTNKSSIDKIESQLQGITTDLSIIKTSFLSGDVAPGRSPRKLNEKGQKLSGLIDGKKIAEQFIGKIDFEPKANGLRIEKASIDFATKELLPLLDEQTNDLLEVTAFEQGEELYTLLLIIGFEMRDIKLKQLGIDIDALG